MKKLLPKETDVTSRGNLTARTGGKQMKIPTGRGRKQGYGFMGPGGLGRLLRTQISGICAHLAQEGCPCHNYAYAALPDANTYYGCQAYPDRTFRRHVTIVFF